MENEKTIEVLNSLITINNDRIEGYQTAMNETEEQDLQRLFSGFVQSSQKCKQELVSEVNNLGGEPAEGTKTSGKIYRAWMDVKAALTGKDRASILNSCEYGEDVAKQTYEDAIKNDSEHLTPNQQSMINAHRTILRADHEHVHALRNSTM